MIKKICVSVLFLLTTLSSILTAVNYEIKDISTLQTHSSQAIAINNQGQILGRLNIDGTKEGEYFFVRDGDGSFHEIVEDKSVVYEDIHQNLSSMRIDWKYLTDSGIAYGIFDAGSYVNLFMWDKTSVTKIGKMLKNDISNSNNIMKINNSGQILIKHLTHYIDSKPIYNPAIWHNGKTTTLTGLEGGLGIASNESYGLDMNNKGEVVGHSLTSLVYKNEIYKYNHAALWTNRQAIDMHKYALKATSSQAVAINDLGDVLIKNPLFEVYLVHNDGTSISVPNDLDKLNENYVYNNRYVFNKKGDRVIDIHYIRARILKDIGSIWMDISKIIGVNNNGEVIAQGETIYGEKHAMLLCPAS